MFSNTDFKKIYLNILKLIPGIGMQIIGEYMFTQALQRGPHPYTHDHKVKHIFRKSRPTWQVKFCVLLNPFRWWSIWTGLSERTNKNQNT